MFLISTQSWFVPCTNHSLNLVCVHVALVFADQLFFRPRYINGIILLEKAGANVQCIVETRCSRANAVDVARKKFTEIIAA